MVLFLHEKKYMYPGAGFAVLTRLRCFLFAGFQNMLEIRITSSCMDAQLSEFSCRYILEAISQQCYVSQIFEFSELGYFLELREKSCASSATSSQAEEEEFAMIRHFQNIAALMRFQ